MLHCSCASAGTTNFAAIRGVTQGATESKGGRGRARRVASRSSAGQVEQLSRCEAELRHGSIVSSDRVVFNIKGNDYRMVTAIDYRRQAIYINGSDRTGTTTRSTQGRWSMEIKPIRSNADHERALLEIQRLWVRRMELPKGTGWTYW